MSSTLDWRRFFNVALAAAAVFMSEELRSEPFEVSRSKLAEIRPFVDQLFRNGLLPAPFCARVAGYQTRYAAREGIQNELLPDIYTLRIRDEHVTPRTFEGIYSGSNREKYAAEDARRIENIKAWRNLVVNAGIFREVPVSASESTGPKVHSELVLTRKGYEAYGWECLEYARAASWEFTNAFKRSRNDGLFGWLVPSYQYTLWVDLIGKPHQWAMSSGRSSAELWRDFPSKGLNDADNRMILSLRAHAQFDVVKEDGRWQIAQRWFSRSMHKKVIANSANDKNRAISRQQDDADLAESAFMKGELVSLTSDGLRQIILSDVAPGFESQVRLHPCHRLPYEYGRQFPGNDPSVFSTRRLPSGQYQLSFTFGKDFPHPDNHFSFQNALEHAKRLVAAGFGRLESWTRPDKKEGVNLVLNEEASAAIEWQTRPDCLSLGTGRIESVWLLQRALPGSQVGDLPFEVAFRGWARVEAPRPGMEKLRAQFPSVRMILDAGYGFQGVLHYRDGKLRVKEWKALLPTFSIGEDAHQCNTGKHKYCGDATTGFQVLRN
jgi:hypothetical protein